MHWCTENLSLCAGKLAREEKIHSFGILRCGRQGILPFQLSAGSIIFLSLTTSYTKSHMMYLFCLFFYLLYILWLCLQTHRVPCSEALFSSLFPSSWVSDLFATWPLPRHSHGKQLYSQAKVKTAITVFVTITTSAGGGAAFENAACSYHTAVGKQYQSQALGCSPSRGP